MVRPKVLGSTIPHTETKYKIIARFCFSSHGYEKIMEGFGYYALVYIIMYKVIEKWDNNNEENRRRERRVC